MAALSARGLGAAAICAAFCGWASLAAQSPEGGDLAERFNFSGDVLVRGIGVGRDIPLTSAPTETGVARTEESYAEFYQCRINPQTCQRSRTREEQDYYTFRFRLNLAFRASQYADVLYGLEVGDLIFGRDSRNSGPGSGGRREGATNLETRQALLRLHDEGNLRVLDLGVFPFSTPNGIVLARTGAGARFAYDPRRFDSTFELAYFRAIDNSQIDGDSNGFSDENFGDIHLAAARWKWSGLRSVRPELYGVYRADEDPSAVDDSQTGLRETSRLYWAGLYLQLKYEALELTLHGIGNWGRFNRPLADDPNTAAILAATPESLNAIVREAYQPPLNEEYRVNAGAWNSELAYAVFDSLKVSLVFAGASGLPERAREPDGSSPAYRPDQFRQPEGSFQFSELVLDDSGGYSVFPGGRLTGVQAAGLRLRWQALEKLETRFDYYRYDSFRPISVRYNSRYTALKNQAPATFLGEEYNLRLKYAFFSDLKLSANLGCFNAATAYKALLDAEYGDYAWEVQIALAQEF